MKLSKISPLAISLLFSLIFSNLSVAEEGSYDLVRKGEALSEIVLRKDAGLPEQHAAEELQTYLEKISDVKVPIVAEASGEKYPVYLGILSSLSDGERERALQQKGEDLAEQGFILKADKHGLSIVGKEALGVLYGTYTFLENLGVRWMMPGKEGEYYPQEESITIKEMETLQNPSFVRRRLVLTCTNVTAWLEDTWDWMVRNKMEINIGNWPFFTKDAEKLEWFRKRGVKIQGGGHVLASFIPEEEYFENHPEYFSLIDGKRIPGGHAAGESADGRVYQRCTSNPEVIDISAEYIKNFFKGGDGLPPGDTFLIGNNDGNGWCECDACRALDDPIEAKDHRVTTRFFKFINAVAQKVWKEYPDKDITTWGYQMFRKAPLGVVPDPRLQVFVAMHGRCYRHALDDDSCPSSKEMRGILKDWAKFGNVFGVREYYACFIEGGDGKVISYVPLEDIVARDIKYVSKIGGTIWADETPPPDGVFGPKWDHPSTKESWEARFPMYYVAAKLLWDVNQDTEAIKDDVYRIWYGDAFEEMKAYRGLLAKSWSEGGHFIYGGKPVFIGKSLEQPGRQKELSGLLDKALKKVENDQVRTARVGAEKRYFHEIWEKMAEELRDSTAWSDVIAGTRKGAIEVDGNLDEEDWATAPVVTGFRLSENQEAEAQTFVKVLHDKEALWLGVELLEPHPDQLKISAKERDDAVWTGDSLEIFIDPEKSGSDYFHIVIDPKGTIYDTKCKVGGEMDKSFNGDFEVATRVLDDRWVVEIRIPAETLGAKIVEGGSWKVNVARSRRGAKAEISSWADGSFHSLDSMRPVVFGEKGALIRNGGFEEIVEIKTDRDRKFYGVGDWDLANDPPIYPVRWSLHGSHPGTLTVTTEEVHSGRQALKIENGWIHSGFFVEEDARLHISFWAKGEGNVHIMLFRYQSDENRATLRTFPTVEVETIPLESAWQKYTFENVNDDPDVNRMALAFAVRGTLLLDDVSVEIDN